MSRLKDVDSVQMKGNTIVSPTTKTMHVTMIRRMTIDCLRVMPVSYWYSAMRRCPHVCSNVMKNTSTISTHATAEA